MLFLAHCNKSMCSFQDHFDRTHLKRAITVTPVPTLMCRRSCKGATRGHYHCSFCTLMSASTSKIQIHVNNVHSHLVGKAALDVANGRPIDLAGCAPTNEKSDLKSCDEPHDRDREKYVCLTILFHEFYICLTLCFMNFIFV